jgi:hypothetical protein
VPPLLQQELLKSCLKDVKDNIVARVCQERVKWTCPAWVIPKKKEKSREITYRRVQIANFLLDLGILLSLEKCEVLPKRIIHFLG